MALPQGVNSLVEHHKTDHDEDRADHSGVVVLHPGLEFAQRFVESVSGNEVSEHGYGHRGGADRGEDRDGRPGLAVPQCRSADRHAGCCAHQQNLEVRHREQDSGEKARAGPSEVIDVSHFGMCSERSRVSHRYRPHTISAVPRTMRT